MNHTLPADRVLALRRAGTLGVAKIAYRGREASRGQDVNAPAAPPAYGESAPTRRALALDDPALALRVLRAEVPRRFFAGAEAAAVAALLERFPDHCRAVIESAEALACAQPWKAAGSRQPIAADPAAASDPTRHHWLVRLAQAHALTREPRFALACTAAIAAWLDGVDGGEEPDFARSPELGFRLMSWSWALALLRESPDVPGIWITRLLAELGEHAAHVSRSLSHYCPPPTHLTGNALALLYAGTVFPESGDAARWRDAAVRVLVAESESQICADGVHFEQSTCFHAFTADVYVHFLLLAARNGIEVPQPVLDRVERLFDFLVAIQRPDGSIPSIGDADGGCLVPLSPRPGGDARGRLAVAAAMFGRPDFAWAAGEAAPEIAWLMGAPGLAAFDRLRPAPPATAPSRVFPSGGYAVMRTGWERDAHQMIVDIGPLGCPVSSGHGHADLLGIQCAIFGEPAIVDPGTHCYGGDSKWRDYFRSTAAHSCVVVDGASQAEPAGPFGWRRHPRARLREWHSTPDFDFLDAEHDGYTALPQPVMHRRRVIFVKPAYWVLVDDLAGEGRHTIDLTFQFAGPTVRLEAHPWARAATPSGPVLWISPFPSAPAQPALKCGEPSPIRGWISPEFARLSPAPMLIYSFAVALPWRIVTLLLPDRQGLPIPPAVRPLYDAGGLPHGFVFERPRRVLRFDDRAVLVERD